MVSMSIQYSSENNQSLHRQLSVPHCSLWLSTSSSEEISVVQDSGPYGVQCPSKEVLNGWMRKSKRCASS